MLHPVGTGDVTRVIKRVRTGLLSDPCASLIPLLSRMPPSLYNLLPLMITNISAPNHSFLFSLKLKTAFKKT